MILQKTALRSLLPKVMAAVLIGGATACTYALMTGKTDRPSEEMSWGLAHPARMSYPQRVEFGANVGPASQWRVLTTPTGGHAVMGMTENWVTMMIDADHDPRYFVMLVQEKPCSSPPGETLAARFKTIKGTSDVERRIWPKIGPWTRGQIAYECRHMDGEDHIQATNGAVNDWMMRVVAGEKATIHTGGPDSTQGPIADAVDLVMNNGAVQTDQN